MEFSNTPVSPIPNLDVMEIDPAESMKTALADWAALAGDLISDGEGDMKDKLGSFQQWLSGIPGIDEATALSQAIKHIESGQYDMIVFDTAPTGHTLKLLALPEILQAGITTLQSWQSTLYGYWDTFKGLAATGGTAAAEKRAKAKEEVSQKLQDYKQGIQKVALMLQDQRRTRFVVVCIAEFLSVNETKRLLVELQHNGVKASHIIVNQLVTNDALDAEQLEELEALAEVGSLNLDRDLLRKTVHACRLTTSRKAIQGKYLKELRACDEAGDLDGLCEVPLLPEEVTGVDALRRFASLLVADGAGVGGGTVGPKETMSLYDDEIRTMNETPGEEAGWSPARGDAVKIRGLAKSEQYNGLRGTVTSERNEGTGRYGVAIRYDGERKVLALQLSNLSPAKGGSKKPRLGGKDADGPAATVGAPGAAAGGAAGKIAKLLEDPEIKALVEKNPKFESAVKDCLENPMNAMQYLGDPEMSPLISKIMSKM